MVRERVNFATRNALDTIKVKTPQLVFVADCEVAARYHEQVTISGVRHAGLEMIGCSTAVPWDTFIYYDTVKQLHCNKCFIHCDLANTVPAFYTCTMASTK